MEEFKLSLEGVGFGLKCGILKMMQLMNINQLSWIDASKYSLLFSQFMMWKKACTLISYTSSDFVHPFVCFNETNNSILTHQTN